LPETAEPAPEALPHQLFSALRLPFAVLMIALPVGAVLLTKQLLLMLLPFAPIDSAPPLTDAVLLLNVLWVIDAVLALKIPAP
jgi:hypothetical protein